MYHCVWEYAKGIHGDDVHSTSGTSGNWCWDRPVTVLICPSLASYRQQEIQILWVYLKLASPTVVMI